MECKSCLVIYEIDYGINLELHCGLFQFNIFFHLVTLFFHFQLLEGLGWTEWVKQAYQFKRSTVYYSLKFFFIFTLTNHVNLQNSMLLFPFSTLI